MAPLHQSPRYTVRNPYSYCFRVRVPLKLHRLVGRKELRYSLQTGYKSIAKEKAQYLAGNVLHLFRLLHRYREMLENMSEDLIQKLVKKYIRTHLKNSQYVIN